ncbi:hypothetical protein [Actinoplanes sp. N902-109]|uniref:hypothetical protein n=1 Tax=Actinoplanes sp. (strain N902-109) TaxID=649831 RepID=UPI0005A091F8|nr:hypothetical protein [Actinoplanes sp. N902-109]
MTALRTVVGALTLVGALTWILLNLHGPAPVADPAVGLVLAAGGLVLLMPHRVGLPLVPVGLVAAAGAVVGTAAGLLLLTTQIGGMFAYAMSRGWPYAWLGRTATADTTAAARALAERSAWHFDVINLLADLYFWGIAGLLVAVVLNKGRFRT